MSYKRDCIYIKIRPSGDFNVGKSSIMKRMADDTFDLSYSTTKEADFRNIELNIDNKQVKVLIWDNSTYLAYKNFETIFSSGIDVEMIVYDVSNQLSFNNIVNWMNRGPFFDKPKYGYILVGNKIDANERVITKEKAIKFATEHSMPYIETSAKTGEGIREAFQLAVKKYIFMIQLI